METKQIYKCLLCHLKGKGLKATMNYFNIKEITVNGECTIEVTPENRDKFDRAVKLKYIKIL